MTRPPSFERTRFLLTAAFLAGLVTSVSAAPEGRLALSDFEPMQGEALLVSVQGARDVDRIEGEFLGSRLPFYPTDDGGYEAVAGVDLEQEPGRYSVRVHLRSGSGETIVLSEAFAVREGKFEIDRLTVKEKMVDFDPETEARIAAEQARMKQTFEIESPRLFGLWFDLPVPGRVSSSFGRRRILNGKPRSPHSGADISATAGTLVRAPTAGRVVLTDDMYLPGKVVVLDHGLGVFSGYYHLKEIRVRDGQTLASGDVIGFVGATGRVTGPHLHWMTRVGSARIDPLSLARLRFSRESGSLAGDPRRGSSEMPSGALESRGPSGAARASRS